MWMMIRNFCVAAALLGCASAARAETVVVTADRMIDVLAGKIVPNPMITIVDGRITRVETAAPGSVVLENDKKVIALRGKTILPGLIDMHVHLA